MLVYGGFNEAVPIGRRDVSHDAFEQQDSKTQMFAIRRSMRGGESQWDVDNVPEQVISLGMAGYTNIREAEYSRVRLGSTVARTGHSTMGLLGSTCARSAGDR